VAVRSTVDDLMLLRLAALLGAPAGLGVWALWFLHRWSASTNRLTNVLHALSKGQWSARAALEKGPLQALGEQLDALASATERELAELRASRSELECLVSTDRLTGVGNRRAFDQRMELECALSKRYGIPVSVILLDVDHFKNVNDDFGHAVGDRVLVTLARRVTARLRDTDSVARWGGEEFAVITPCTPLLGAAALAEGIRQRVAEEPFETAGPVSISLGVAQLLPGETVDEWLSRADSHLYEAKQRGRNRCASASFSVSHRSDFQLVWGAHFATGHAGVDAEHAELFRLANEIARLPPNCAASELLARYDRLISHVTFHFESEERLLGELSCSETEEHAALHRGLVRQAAELRQRLVAGELSLFQIGDFVVRRVTIGHLVTADLPLFARLETRSGTLKRASGC
jgi:diguanylate cyclase (GGDEF)-like protein/hemerythrin-like metal-binding protein